MIRELSRYVLSSPEPFVLDLERSRGMWLATVDGQRIFDWGGYYASKLLSHNHPGLRGKDYLRRLALAANNKTANPDFLTRECLEYYRLVHSLAPRCMRGKRLEVYTINSGAEAVENMMKYMINLHDEKLRAAGRKRGLRRFIYFDSAFHGRTVFALNVTRLAHDPVITKDFQGVVPGNLQVPFPALDFPISLREMQTRTRHSLDIVRLCLQRYPDEVVGIVVEPIQGAGGHRVAEAEFFRGLSRLAHRFGVFLGFDEVQTAGGQAGTVFAIDQFDLPYPPQAVATAKKFGCGVVYMLYPMKDHGVLDSTWGGSLADMVRFVQEWKIVRRERLIEKVPAKAARLVGGLWALVEKHAGLLSNIRGLGLYQGFSLPSEPERAMLQEIALETEDLFLLPAGERSIRLRPMLDVTKGDIDLFLEKLDRSLGRMKETA
jgi:L-lysine 6-transaminase